MEGLAEVGYAPGKSANLDPVRVDPLPSALASGLNLGPKGGLAIVLELNLGQRVPSSPTLRAPT